MLDYKVIARAFCERELKPRIDNRGLNAGLNNKKRIQLFYAGPSKDTKVKLYGEKRKIKLNWELAAKLARRLNAGRIDDTETFAYLRSDAFNTDFNRLPGVNKLGDKEREAAIQQIWYFASARFACTDFEEAATLACGAGAKSSFRKREMRNMLKGKHLKIVNKRPVGLFRDFEKLGGKELFRLESITILLMLRDHAQKTGTKTAWAEYKRQRKFHLEFTHEFAAAFRKLPIRMQASIRQKRKEILAKYNPQPSSSVAINLAITALKVVQGAGGPYVPATVMPSTRSVGALNP